MSTTWAIVLAAAAGVAGYVVAKRMCGCGDHAAQVVLNPRLSVALATPAPVASELVIRGIE